MKILPDIKRWLIKITVLILLLFPLLNFVFAEEIILNAESVIYDRQNGKIVAEKDVRVKYKDIIIETQSLTYDTDKNIIYTTTDTSLLWGRNRLFIKNLYYDIKSEKILVEDFYTYYEPYYSYSKSCEVKKGESVLTDAKVTHCNLPVPHYYLRSNRVIVYPGEKIKLYSPSIVVGKIPVLWLPYYETSLKPSKDYLVVEPGYENKRGIITKLKYGRKIFQHSELQLLCDTYGVENFGVGMEYRYMSNLYDGVIYGYLINELINKKYRWNIRVKNNHVLLRNWNLKSNIELISDEQLYSYYEKNNWFLVKRDVNSNISISRDTQKTSLRLSYLRKDVYHQDRFVNSYYQTPLEYRIYPLNLWKFKISDNLNITPTFVESTTYYHLKTENSFLINLPYKIYMINLVPQMCLQTVVISSQSLSVYWYNIYNFLIPVRYNLYGYGFTEIVYDYKIKSEDNKFSVIFSSTNIVSNNLHGRLNLFYKGNFIRIYTSYDIAKLDVSKWYERILPVITEVNFLYKKFDFTSRAAYNITKTCFENLNFSLGYKHGNGQIKLSYGNNLSRPDLHFITPEMNFYVPENYQLKLRSSLNICQQKLDIINSNIELYKDLHCWEAKIVCNIRKFALAGDAFPYIFELGGNIALKFKPYVGSGGKVSEIDQKYLPWRE